MVRKERIEKEKKEEIEKETEEVEKERQWGMNEMEERNDLDKEETKSNEETK